MLKFFIGKAGEVRQGAIVVSKEWWALSFLWYLHLESILCCDLLILKPIEKFLLSSSTTGMCSGSSLQLQFNSSVLACISEWPWSVSICFLCMWFDLVLFPTETNHNCLFSFFFWGIPYVLVISYLPAPPYNPCPFSFHSCLDTYFLASFCQIKRLFLFFHFSL